MAGGDTSPPHNSWQPGQRRPPSCRRRSTRSRDRRRRRCSRSCRLCLCSSCYCGEGGFSAAAGSAGSRGVGNQRWPVCEHLHLQPLRMSPCPRSYSGLGTQRPARRRHGSAGLRRGQRHPRQRQSQPQPWPRSGSPWERSSGLHTHNTRPGLVLSPALPAGRRPGGRGRGRGRPGRIGALRLPRLGRRKLRSSSNSVRGGRVAQQGDPGKGRLRIGAKFEALSASQPWDGGGRGMVCERLRALRA